MAINYNRKEIADGIFVTTITDGMFKTNYITVNIITKLDSEKAATNAAIPIILTKCCDKYKDVAELNKRLTFLYGTNLSGDVYKNADNQAISISASCIADRYSFNKEEILFDVADLLNECMFNPYIENNGFSEKIFSLCKQELIDDIDAEINDKRSYAIISAGKNIYKGEPSEISSHGDRAHAEKITAESAYKQYINLLETARIEIMFTGAEVSENAINTIADKFRKITRNYDSNIKSEFSPLKKTKCEVVDNMDVVQSKMVMAFKSDCKNDVSINLMNSIFGGTPFSKLFLNVREKYSLCYYCSSGYNDGKGVLIVDSGVEKDNIDKAKNEILNQLEEVKKGNFTDEEIENSLLSIINRIKAVNDSPYSLASWYLKQAVKGTDYTPSDEITRLRSVTRQDIIDAAKSFNLDTTYVLTSKGE